MIEAVLDGEGLQGVAELAAVEAGGPVAIVLRPAAWRHAPGGGELNGLARYAKARVTDTRATGPDCDGALDQRPADKLSVSFCYSIRGQGTEVSPSSSIARRYFGRRPLGRSPRSRSPMP